MALAAILLCATAVLGSASLRLPTFTGFLLAAYAIAAGEVVVLTEVLSIFHRVAAPEYLFGELLLLVVACMTWIRRGRPLQPFPAIPLRLVFHHPALGLLAAGLLAAICYQAFLGFTTPPNSWDSMTYHLAKAAEWYQRGGVEYYPTHSESVNSTQPNAEMLALYTFAFAGRDTFAATPALIAELASVVAVYGLATRLGFSRAASAFAALLTATLTQVALQSVTTQNDLLTSSFLATALYFALGHRTAELGLAGLAVGLAVGTKATAIIGLPLLLLAAVLVHQRRHLLRGVALACAGFFLVGAYGYALNVVHTGRPLGDPSALGPLRRDDHDLLGTASTAARVGYKFIDFSGYPIPDRATEPVEDTAEWLFRVARIPVNPASSTILGPPVPSPFTFTINTAADEIPSYFGPLSEPSFSFHFRSASSLRWPSVVRLRYSSFPLSLSPGM